MTQRFGGSGLATFDSDNFPPVILVRSDGWVCLDYVGDRRLKTMPEPNAVLNFPDESLARRFLRLVCEKYAIGSFEPKVLSWKEWLGLAAQKEREGMTYYGIVLQLEPSLVQAAVRLSDLTEMAKNVRTTDGQHKWDGPRDT